MDQLAAELKSVPSKLRNKIYSRSNQGSYLITIPQCSVLWYRDGGRGAGDGVGVISLLGPNRRSIRGSLVAHELSLGRQVKPELKRV